MDIPDAARCEDAPELLDTPVAGSNAATGPQRKSLRARSKFEQRRATRSRRSNPGGCRDARRSRVKGQGEGLASGCAQRACAQGSGQRQVQRPRPHRPLHGHGWVWGTGLMFIGRMAAGPRVHSCRDCGAEEGAQDTATPPRERPWHIPRADGPTKDAAASRRGRDSYTHHTARDGR